MTEKTESPLDVYRKEASFPVYELVRVLEPDAELLRLKVNLWKTLEREPEFQRPVITPVHEQQKRLTARMLRKWMQSLLPKFLTPEIMSANYSKKTRFLMSMNEALAVYNRSLSVKFALGVSLFGNALPSLGSARHTKYSDAAWRGDILSCFAITEIAHGSNTKQLRTTATYDPRTEEFVIHTPDFEAAKCWAGNLGRTCTYSVVFAQLHTPDGTNHGLHGFIVPIRDPQSLVPYPGVTVGDMGEKMGLNGIDNGFVLFSNYRIPKANLLNRAGDVDEEGNYQTSFTNPEQILGAVLENLTAGRIAISQEATQTLSCATTIAIRYGAVRKQFGPKPGTEQHLISYPTHQWRLFPYLSAACVFRVFIFDFTQQYLQTVEASYSSTASFSELSDTSSEIHAVVSSCKPMMTWTTRDGIQVCREACGGHGYLKAAGLGDLRNDHEPSVTYEGDNTVLIQQTSNWLLRQWTVGAVSSPLHTVDFLARKQQIQHSKFNGTQLPHVTNLPFIQRTYEWLLCWLMEETSTHLAGLQKVGVDRFTARNESQVYRASSLALAYAEFTALSYVQRRFSATQMDASVKKVLERMAIIYGLWSLDKHLPFLYQGGYAVGGDLARLVREGLISLCRELKRDAVAIVDAIAPTDFALNSVLGQSDGLVYQHLQKALLKPSATQRADWWREAVVSKL